VEHRVALSRETRRALYLVYYAAAGVVGALVAIGAVHRYSPAVKLSVISAGVTAGAVAAAYWCPRITRVRPLHLAAIAVVALAATLGPGWTHAIAACAVAGSAAVLFAWTLTRKRFIRRAPGPRDRPRTGN
jgi:membrane associated rhomboid family serine protease